MASQPVVDIGPLLVQIGLLVYICFYLNAVQKIINILQDHEENQTHISDLTPY